MHLCLALSAQDGQMGSCCISKSPCPADSKGSQGACALARAEWQTHYTANSPFWPSHGKVGKREEGETVICLFPLPPDTSVSPIFYGLCCLVGSALLGYVLHSVR